SVGATGTDPNFATAEEKEKAVQKAFTDLTNKYPDQKEGLLARYYLGIMAAEKGNLQEAEKQLKQVAESGEDAYASQAKLSLSQIYQSQDRAQEAEALLKSLIDNPTVLVSKEQATLALARVYAKSKPEEARKLLEPLRTERGAVSRLALTALSELPPAPAK
ncbi:MAG: tetratricopeptide repeat protein, partial [Bryobacteraceae bacterium]